MEIDSTVSLFFLLVSLVAFSLVSTVSASLSILDRAKIQSLCARGVAGARTLENLLAWSSVPDKTLSPIKFMFMMTTILSGILFSTVWWDSRLWLGFLIWASVMSLLGFLQFLSMTLSIAYGESIALKSSRIVWTITRVFAPLYSLDMFSGVFLRPFTNGQDHVSNDENFGDLGTTLNPDTEPLDEREARMIRGVVRLDQTTAREIMIPRLDILAEEIGVSISDMATLMVKSGHSRVPIYRGDLDQILGIAYARDVLGQLNLDESNPGNVTSDLIRPVLFIPESKTLEELLNEFQERRVHMAIVVDEYGGVAGLVTIEDLLEEIVGEINDEFDVDEPEIQQINQDEFLLDARVALEQLEELLQVKVEGDGFDTVGGLIYQRLGRIPAIGDSIEYDGLRIEVRSTVGRRLKRLHIGRRSSNSPGE